MSQHTDCLTCSKGPLYCGSCTDLQPISEPIRIELPSTQCVEEGQALQTQDEAIQVLRGRLKVELMELRGALTTLGWKPVCPICNLPILTPDMHEAIITRGDAMKSNLQDHPRLYVAENCVLVHPGRCHSDAATRRGQDLCIRNLLKYTSLERINAWLETLKCDGLLSEGAVYGAQRRVIAVSGAAAGRSV
jgi:hypothetical protein